MPVRKVHIGCPAIIIRVGLGVLVYYANTQAICGLVVLPTLILEPVVPAFARPQRGASTVCHQVGITPPKRLPMLGWAATKDAKTASKHTEFRSKCFKAP
jgi:hypothetical protein